MKTLDELLAESMDEEDFNQSSMGNGKPLLTQYGIQIAERQYRDVQQTPAERIADLIRERRSHRQ